jgi:hypothetical protein
MYWLYEKKQLSNGTHVYENRVNQPLAGNKNGVFFRAYKKVSNARNEGLWYASKRDLLSVVDCAPETHALVIDTAPNRSEACFHEIHGVAGITANEWTPIMIWLEYLFQDRPPPAGKSLRPGRRASQARVARAIPYVNSPISRETGVGPTAEQAKSCSGPAPGARF